jgi:hypothetical protein
MKSAGFRQEGLGVRVATWTFDDASPGDAISIVLTVGGVASQASVTISVQ